MSVLAILGLNGYTLTGTRNEFTQEANETTIKTYEGPIDKIQELYTSSRADVLSGEIDRVTKTQRDGLGVLELHYADSGADTSADPSDELENTIWELLPQDLYKSIRSYNGDVAGSQAFNKDANQDDLEDTRLWFETAKKEGVDPSAEPQSTYLKLLRRGTDQYVRTVAVLQSRITVSRRSLVNADWTGVDRAWRISGDANNGGPDLSVGQSALLGTIQSMPEAQSDSKQWLKRGPSVTMTGNQSYTITHQWWFSRAWSANLYGGDAVDGNP